MSERPEHGPAVERLIALARADVDGYTKVVNGKTVHVKGYGQNRKGGKPGAGSYGVAVPAKFGFPTATQKTVVDKPPAAVGKFLADADKKGYMTEVKKHDSGFDVTVTKNGKLMGNLAWELTEIGGGAGKAGNTKIYGGVQKVRFSYAMIDSAVGSQYIKSISGARAALGLPR